MYGSNRQKKSEGYKKVKQMENRKMAKGTQILGGDMIEGRDRKKEFTQHPREN